MLTLFIGKLSDKLTQAQRRYGLAALLLLAGFIVAGVAYAAFVRPQPAGFSTQRGPDVAIHYASDRDRVLWPLDCARLSWQVTGATQVLLSPDAPQSEPVAATGERIICADAMQTRLTPELRVLLPDESERRYDLTLEVMAYNPVMWGLMALSVALFGAAVAIAFNLRLRAAWALRVGLIFGIVAACIQIGIHVAHAFMREPMAWDDAYMFARYLYHWQHHGVLAWNAAEGPVYGLTELLYVLPVFIASRFISFDTPGLMVQMASVGSGILFLLLLVVLVWRVVRGDATRKLAVLFVVFVGLASHESLGAHFASGMGTTFAMAYLTAYLLVVDAFVRRPDRAWMAVVAVWGGFAYFVRPDMLLFTTIVPLVLFLFAKDAHMQRRAFWLGIIMGGVIVLQMAFAAVYFGSALPLPFYAKSTGIYDAYYENRYAPIPAQDLGRYLQANLFYLVVMGAGVLVNVGQWRQRVGLVERGYMAALIGYIAYYLFFVLQVMHYYERFYYPTLPVIILLVILSASVLLDRIAQSVDWQRSLSVAYPVGAMALVLAVLISAWMPHVSAIQHHPEPIIQIKTRNQLAWIYTRVWFEVQHVAQISDDMVIATSDVGLPGIANYNWTVVDLASLNQTAFIYDGFSSELLLDGYQPDLIYMPGPHYEDLSQVILADADFAADYDFYPASQIGNYTDVAIRRDSPYYARMREIIQATMPQ